MNTMNEHSNHIAIVGGGIIGISSAINLRGRGFDVTVIDRDEPFTGASAYNAGAIATPEVLPLASPGMLMKAPKWLLDPNGPLAIPPSYFLRIAPWLFRFWRASTRKQVLDSVQALGALMQISLPAVERLYGQAGIMDMLTCTGALYLYESEAEFRRAKANWDLRASVGVAFDHIDGDTLRDMEPALSPHFTYATHMPNWTMVSDPLDVGQALCRHASEVGVRMVRDAVTSIQGSNVVLQQGGTIAADQIVLAAGAWSHHLARGWGEKVPLETERGYNTTIPDPGIQVTRELIFGEHGIVASGLTSGFRIGGAAELGGLQAPPNYARADSMLRKARRFLPDLKTEGGTQWMGFRPSLPDSKPVIGRSPLNPRVVHAYGHGHLGLTQGPATAELVADIVSDTTPAIDLTPFRPDRF